MDRAILENKMGGSSSRIINMTKTPIHTHRFITQKETDNYSNTKTYRLEIR